MYCKKCGTELLSGKNLCNKCSDLKYKKIGVVIGIVLFVVFIITVINNGIKTTNHNNLIKQVSEEQTTLYTEKLIPTLMNGFNNYTVNNVNFKEIDPKGQCDYAIQLDCELTIGESRKFNYPLIVLFNNDESNPKYQNSEDATKDIIEAIKVEKEKEEKLNRLSQIVNVKSQDLINAYINNEVKANELYSGKTGMITGKIKSIDIQNGKPCIVLANKDSDSISDISCYFEDNNQSSKIASFKKGQTVTIKGEIKGLSIWDVYIDNCTLK